MWHKGTLVKATKERAGARSSTRAHNGTSKRPPRGAARGDEPCTGKYHGPRASITRSRPEVQTDCGQREGTGKLGG